MNGDAFHFHNGGKFISRGRGRHGVRTIHSMELILVVSGSLGMFEEDKTFELHAGDFLFLYPDRRHGGTLPYPKNLSFFWGHFTGSTEALDTFPQSGHAMRSERMADFFSMLLSEEEEEENAPCRNLLLALVMNETRRASPENGTASRGAADLAERIITLRFAEALSSASIAAELHCNADYLGRSFRKRHGCSITEYLNRVRLKKAAAMIASGGASIKTAAFACGFSDCAYFRRRFLREYSMRPSEYRKLRTPGHMNTE